MNPTQYVFTRNEFCKEYRVPESTERKRRGEPGWIPHYSVGRRVFYRRTAIEQWIAAREIASEAAQGG